MSGWRQDKWRSCSADLDKQVPSSDLLGFQRQRGKELMRTTDTALYEYCSIACLTNPLFTCSPNFSRRPPLVAVVPFVFVPVF